MYESLAGIKFTGAAFKQPTEMQFFPNEQIRACLMYGKNGSGKSTISKTTLKIRGKDIPEISLAQAVKVDHTEAILSEEEKRHIFVFNEDYIEENVRLKQDGLSTIVMLGGQGALEEKIKQATALHDSTKSVLEAKKGTHAQFVDASLVTAPAFYITKMKSALQGDTHWAGRERIISRTGKHNASVRDNTYLDIVRNVPTESADEILRLFTKKLTLLQTTADETKRISRSVPVDITLKFTEASMLEALATEIPKPELTEREVYLLKIAEADGTSQLGKMEATFGDPATKTCPFCLQPVQEAYKSDLVESIKKILSKIVEDHLVLLSQMVQQTVSFDFTPFSELNSTVLQTCKSSLTALNDEIEKANTLLKKKQESVYTPIIDCHLSLVDKLNSYIDSMKQLEITRQSYNHQFDKIDDLRQELQDINLKLSYYDIIDLYNSFIAQTHKMTKSKRELNALEQAEKEADRKLNELMQQKKNIRVAVDEINRGLQYVFFSKTRLHIEVADTVYSLSSNGNSVRPADVSSGERNVIALCYFFVDILTNLEKEKAYEQTCFLVIDDPVSSFDLENRIGILSFLKAQLLKVFCGAANSKALIMTHDLPTFYDLDKVLGEIKNAATIKYGKNTSNYCLVELTNRQLRKFQEKKRHEYTELLSAIYEYADGISTEYDMVIGNVMRRALEAFATFEYKKGIDTVSCDESILDSLGNPVFHDYFQNLMYRILLNGESHMEERVKSLSDPTLASNATEENKTKAAKDVLCMIYLLNKAHVKAHLANETNAVEKIEVWCQEIIDTNASIPSFV